MHVLHCSAVTDEADLSDSFELRAILRVEREHVALAIGGSSEQCQGHVVKPSQFSSST